jgi:hypothetical protein
LLLTTTWIAAAATLTATINAITQIRERRSSR